ncbi:hypothetical protein K435DRAFT_436420 [Dendrothele bispora CBS 962.96]|uniref:Uncharacterized protein n=1 Tax=Dendrothele bispora (strain CBS 962.96) TaxID=1314807 RepID=A0A4S8L3P6_DENBC|nr:hypothetical protein K435DRAFT_436420 [Dendrothele bispora CBS 962.96]
MRVAYTPGENLRLLELTVDTGMGRWAFEQTVKSIYPPSTLKHFVHVPHEINFASSLTTSPFPTLKPRPSPDTRHRRPFRSIPHYYHICHYPKSHTSKIPWTNPLSLQVNSSQICCNNTEDDLNRLISPSSLTVPLSPYIPIASKLTPIPTITSHSNVTSAVNLPVANSTTTICSPSIADFFRDRRDLRTLGPHGRVRLQTFPVRQIQDPNRPLHLIGLELSIRGVFTFSHQAEGIDHHSTRRISLQHWAYGLISRTVGVVDGSETIGGHDFRDPVGCYQISPGGSTFSSLS